MARFVAGHSVESEMVVSGLRAKAIHPLQHFIDGHARELCREGNDSRARVALSEDVSFGLRLSYSWGSSRRIASPAAISCETTSRQRRQTACGDPHRSISEPV